MDKKQDIQIVVAMAKTRLIGSGGKLPWDLPEDLRLFRELTLGHTIIMGRGTYESIKHPLDGRTNIVISSKLSKTTGLVILPTLTEGLAFARELNQEIFCIGGCQIYQAALPLAAKLHISWVSGLFDGDTFFPEFDLDQWQVTTRRQYEGFTRISYDRK